MTPTCKIVDRFASGIHARVHTRGNAYFVEDLESTNGTYLNGADLRGEAPLNDLDEIRIGDTEFSLRDSRYDEGDY